MRTREVSSSHQSFRLVESDATTILPNITRLGGLCGALADRLTGDHLNYCTPVDTHRWTGRPTPKQTRRAVLALLAWVSLASATSATVRRRRLMPYREEESTRRVGALFTSASRGHAPYLACRRRIAHGVLCSASARANSRVRRLCERAKRWT